MTQDNLVKFKIPEAQESFNDALRVIVFLCKRFLLKRKSVLETG